MRADDYQNVDKENLHSDNISRTETDPCERLNLWLMMIDGEFQTTHLDSRLSGALTRCFFPGDQAHDALKEHYPKVAIINWLSCQKPTC